MLFLAGVGVHSAQAVEPGFKLGLGFNDQFKAAAGSYTSSDTQADREIVPTVFVGVPFGRWRWVPTLSFLEKGGHVSFFVTDTLAWWG